MLPLDETRREFERLQSLDKPYYVPTDVARILGCESYSVNLAAHDNPAALGFPIILTGRRVRIPRASFLDFVARNVLGSEVA